jgi:hypothetical protein
MRAFYTSKIFLSQFVVTSSLFFFHLASLKLESGVTSCSNFVARVTPALSLQTAIKNQLFGFIPARFLIKGQWVNAKLQSTSRKLTIQYLFDDQLFCKSIYNVLKSRQCS